MEARIRPGAHWWLTGVVTAGAVAAVALVPSMLAWAAGSRLHVVVILVVAAVLEATPVRVTSDQAIHLTALVIVYAAVVYGPGPASFGALAAVLVGQVSLRKPIPRAAYNCAQSVLGAAAAGFAAQAAVRPLGVIPACVAATLAIYIVNVSLVSLAISKTDRVPFLAQAGSTVTRTASTAAMVAGLVPFIILGVRESIAYGLLAVVPLAALRLHLLASRRAWHQSEMALTDPLTNLGNRRAFNARLSHGIHRAEHRNEPLSVILVDVDRFKQINDVFGHEMGDRVLVTIAGALRGGAEAFRWGGDEFALLLTGVNSDQAAAVTATVRARVAALDAERYGPLSISAGGATYEPFGDLSASDLVRTADLSLYEAKKARSSTPLPSSND